MSLCSYALTSRVPFFPHSDIYQVDFPGQLKMPPKLPFPASFFLQIRFVDDRRIRRGVRVCVGRCILRNQNAPPNASQNVIQNATQNATQNVTQNAYSKLFR